MRGSQRFCGLIMIGGLLLAACGGGDPPRPAAPAAVPGASASTTATAAGASASASRPSTAPATASRPATTAPLARTATAAATSASDALTRALKETPWQPGELPFGWTVARGREGNAAAFLGPARPVGAVSFDAGVGVLEGMMYLVFASEREAKAYFEAGNLPDFRSMATFNGVGLPTPNKCYEGTTVDVGRTAGTTYCTTYTGNVVVLGASIVPGRPRGGENARAAAVTRAALTHLARVQGP